MRQIKFRGRDVYGIFRYGDLWQRTDDSLIQDDEGIWFRVFRKSISQLIATDKNGREVYEGDLVKPMTVLDDEANFFATMYDMRDLDTGKIILAQSLTEETS